jgi:hypothetical protein
MPWPASRFALATGIDDLWTGSGFLGSGRKVSAPEAEAFEAFTRRRALSYEKIVNDKQTNCTQIDRYIIMCARDGGKYSGALISIRVLTRVPARRCPSLTLHLLQLDARTTASPLYDTAAVFERE